ncbi:MAG TPA: tetratricopeptide repeat protein [Pyrinomonadaceae bacterium]|nr:tetratricopeptide repeat protein [Pyrinomonadaceae bacterium]
MKFSIYRIASIFILSSVFALTGSTVQSARGQTASPSPSTSKQDKPSPSPATPQQPTTERERRARAYSKLLEGERHLLELRTAGSAESLRLARQAFQEAATLDPVLAEAHTALAEISFYYPPQDFDAAAREGADAVRIDPDNFGAHKILSRLYAIRSGLREGNLNRQFVDLAIKELKEVARLDKDNAEAWALLGEFYQATGKTEEALSAWANWAAAPPTSDTRFFQYLTNRELSPDAAAARLGEGLLSAGRPKEALAAIRRAIALNPENTDYGELLAQAIEAGGIDDKLAIAELQRMVAADPANTSVAELLARIQARAGRIDDAIATLRSAISHQPKGDRTQQSLRNSLAQLYADSKRYTEAIAVYEEQLKEHGIGNTLLKTDEEKLFAVRTLQRMIDVYKRAGRASDVEAVIDRMRQLLGRDDPSPDAQRIEYLREQGKRTEALQAVRAARKLYPDEMGFLHLEAETLTDLGRIDEAVALLKTQLKNSIEDFTLYLEISNLYLQAGHASEAVEAARKALSLAQAERPEMADAALITLSSAQERAGDPRGSEESLRKILARDPNNATALNNLGYFLIERNERLTEAFEMIQRAVRANPTNASFLDSLGWAYFKLGKLDEAERNLTEAARRNNQSATIQEHLGDLYQRRGKLEQARAAWQRALSLATEAEDTARLRAKLNGKTQK